MSNSGKTSIILVLACMDEPYITIENAQRETWGKDKSIDTIYFYGDESRQITWEDDRLFVPAKESFNPMKKAMLSFKEILRAYPNVEQIFLTNVSSYVRIDKIKEIFKQLPTKRLYSGLPTDVGIGITFASGCGWFCSRDTMEMIYENQSFFDPNENGDVGSARLFKKFNIPLVPQKRFDLINMPWEQIEKLTYNDIKDHWHFRCKQPYNRMKDVECMNILYRLLNEHNN